MYLIKPFMKPELRSIVSEKKKVFIVLGFTLPSQGAINNKLQTRSSFVVASLLLVVRAGEAL